MPMTIVVTRNVPGRFRGFLASSMCEIAPGVYTAPRMTAGVRERVWAVMESWYEPGPEVSVLMTWPSSSRLGGQEVRSLGIPRQELCEYGGVFLARRPLSTQEKEALARAGLGIEEASGQPPPDTLSPAGGASTPGPPRPAAADGDPDAA